VNTDGLCVMLRVILPSYSVTKKLLNHDRLTDEANLSHNGLHDSKLSLKVKLCTAVRKDNSTFI